MATEEIRQQFDIVRAYEDRIRRMNKWSDRRLYELIGSRLMAEQAKLREMMRNSNVDLSRPL